jgi:hypothetical protein
VQLKVGEVRLLDVFKIRKVKTFKRLIINLLFLVIFVGQLKSKRLSKAKGLKKRFGRKKRQFIV